MSQDRMSSTSPRHPHPDEPGSEPQAPWGVVAGAAGLPPGPLGPRGADDAEREHHAPEQAVAETAASGLVEQRDVQDVHADHREGQHDGDLDRQVELLPPEDDPRRVAVRAGEMMRFTRVEGGPVEQKVSGVGVKDAAADVTEKAMKAAPVPAPAGVKKKKRR